MDAETADTDDESFVPVRSPNAGDDFQSAANNVLNQGMYMHVHIVYILYNAYKYACYIKYITYVLYSILSAHMVENLVVA